jgi:hypothetical protein
MDVKNCSRLLAIVMLMMIVKSTQLAAVNEPRTEAQMYYDQIPVASESKHGISVPFECFVFVFACKTRLKFLCISLCETRKSSSIFSFLVLVVKQWQFQSAFSLSSVCFMLRMNVDNYAKKLQGGHKRNSLGLL